MRWIGLRNLGLFFLATCLLVAAVPASRAATTEAVTTSDETVPLGHLTLLLKPLTKAEITVEIEAWQSLLQAKVWQISQTQIVLSDANEALEHLDEIAAALTKIQERQTSLQEAQQAARTEPSAEAAEGVTKAEHELQEAVVALRQAVHEVVADETESAQTGYRQAVLAEAAAVVAVAAEGGKADGKLAEVDLSAILLAPQLTELTLDPSASDEATLQRFGSIEEEAHERHDAVKALLVEYLQLLMTQRRGLTDRLEEALSAWEAKGATVEETVPFRAYMDAVSGIHLETTDTATRWSLLLGWFESEDGGLLVLTRFVKFVVVLAAFMLLAVVLGKATEKALSRMPNLSQLLRDFIIRSVRRIVLIVGLIIALSALGINIGPILALVGAAGFVIAFALQDTLGNFASGIMIMIYKPFDVGDAIDAAGVQGNVESVNLTSTIIKTFDNKHVVVPNNAIWGNVITNITGSDQRRIDMVFGISYTDDMDKAARILNEIVAAEELILSEPEPVIRVRELGDSSVNLICRPWVKTEDYWDVHDTITHAVKARFDAEGISIPFPQTDVHFYQETVAAEPAATAVAATAATTAVAETGRAADSTAVGELGDSDRVGEDDDDS